MADRYHVPPSPLFEGPRNTTITIAASILLVFIAAAFDPASIDFTRDPAITSIAKGFSALGNGATLVVISLVIYLAGRATKRVDLRELGSRSFSAIILGSVAVHLVKAAFDRPRPAHVTDSILHFVKEPWLFDVTGWYNSFPSGHTTVSFAVAFVLARRIPRFAPLIYLVAAFIGLSRIYLGSHFPSDVAGGAVLGLTVGWLIAGAPSGLGSSGGARQPWTRWCIVGLAFAAVIVSFFKTGGFFLFDVDEAVFSEAAREMLLTGDIITPTYNFEPRYDKPILIYWFMSAAFWLFGTSEFAARFTSSGFGVLLTMMTFLFVNRVRGGLAAFIVPLCLLVNLEFLVYSHSAVTDMTLTFFITASLFAFYLGVEEDDGKWFVWAWVAAALAVLTKGVIGLLFPAAISIIYLALTRRLALLKPLLRPVNIIIFLAIAAPWFAIEFSINGREFFDAFIIKHHIQRYSGVVSGHSAPAYFYIVVIIAGFFPWFAFLPNAVRRAVREVRSSSGTGRGGRGGLALFSAVWFFFILLFFSASGTKLPNYIFPLFPAMAIMAGLVITGIIEDFESQGEGAKKPGLYILIMFAVVIAAGLILLPSHDPQMDVDFPDVFFYVTGGLFLATALLALFAYTKPCEALLAIFAVMAILLGYLRLAAIPEASMFLQGTLYEYATYARTVSSEATLATYEINQPSIAFYSRSGFVKIERSSTDQLADFGPDKKLIIITTPGHIPELMEFENLRVVDEKQDYALVANTTNLPPLHPKRSAEGEPEDALEFDDMGELPTTDSVAPLEGTTSVEVPAGAAPTDGAPGEHPISESSTGNTDKPQK